MTEAWRGDAFIDRAFVRIAEGLVHLRRVEAAGDAAAHLPMILLHASPGSSRGLEPLLGALATCADRPLMIAPDTLGHGDSAAPAATAPTIATYADATVRTMDALGIERAIIYGAHTGARIACEAGILHPDRIARVVVDGIGEYAGALRDELVERYAPEIAPDDYGTQMIWAFQFVRDQALHFPHYQRDPAHRLMTRAVPPAAQLHDAAVEVLKALGTYHLAYRAAFAYPTRERLARLRRPLDLIDSIGELPALREQALALAAAAPEGRVIACATGMVAKAQALIAIGRAILPTPIRQSGDGR